MLEWHNLAQLDVVYWLRNIGINIQMLYRSLYVYIYIYICVCVTVSLQAIIIRTHYYEKTSYMLIVFEFSASIH